MSNRRKALDLFKQDSNNKDGYTTFKNTTTFPCDASFPLPLSFFIESDDVNNVIKKANDHLPDYFSTLRGDFDNKRDFVNLLKIELLIEQNIMHSGRSLKFWLLGHIL